MINDLVSYSDSLPKLLKPWTVTQEGSKKSLNSRYLIGDITISTSFVAKTQDEINALYDFWVNDCNHGTKEFVLEENILNINSENNYKLGVKWVGNFPATNRTGKVYEGKVTLLIRYKVNSLNELVAI